ncbi:MAG: GH92 family glycosyl hydrolase [Gemmatimonadota bacterium]
MATNTPRTIRFHAAQAFLLLLVPLAAGCGPEPTPLVADPTAYVDPLIGTANGGNTFPGAVVPFGMVAFSPEVPLEDTRRGAAPGGYQYDARRIRGFALTHLSGTGCRGASGDVPIMPHAGPMTRSPSADTTDRAYAARFVHANETAEAGYYQVRFSNGLNAELTATPRTGAARFSYPADDTATLLIRTSDSEVGSSDAHVTIDPAARTITGSVTSGNFCGYIHPVDRRSYYTLYFVMEMDLPIQSWGTWHDGTLMPGDTTASGGTTYGERGVPPRGLGSGAWVTFLGPGDGGDRASGGSAPGGATPLVGSSASAVQAPVVVHVRVGVSYVSIANARANLEAEQPAGTPFDTVRARARAAWQDALGQVGIAGGTEPQRTTFYTALYHALLHPNLFSDVDGRYMGFDGKVHRLEQGQTAQYANFSGWDVYRSQLQLVTLLQPQTASDIAQSLLNQARQNDGQWDRWTHLTGATHVMEGDASAPAIAGIVAFGGTSFDVKGAYASLEQAATVPTPADSSDVGCPVECPGQRPSLHDWLTLHYIPAKSNAWGGAGETLEDAGADYALAQLAAFVGDSTGATSFRQRSRYWRNLYNPDAPGGGWVQDRNADGSWPDLDPASSRGFAEGSAAQYTWMVPFDADGLFQLMGGDSAAVARLDAFFHNPDGSWALTGLGGLHAEMDNEPSTGTPWMYSFAGRQDQTQATVRAVINRLWHHGPDGIPGNDDLGAMSAWYVWSALGVYPAIPGSARLMVSAPLFPRAEVRRANGKTLIFSAPGAGTNVAFIRALRLDGRRWRQPDLPPSFVQNGGRLDFTISGTP